MNLKRFGIVFLALVAGLAICVGVGLVATPAVIAQEVTGGIQGTVKDPSGAVVPGADVVATGTTLVGSKKTVSDHDGYYRFANLPPGVYTITVTAKGFSTIKQGDLHLDVGRLPEINFTLQVGGTSTVVEVTSAAPLVDTTTNINATNLNSTMLDNTPHGYSFQSVIQFAPMARYEPLAGAQTGGMNGMQSNPGSPAMIGNSGGSLPGSAGNGLSGGFSIGGAADSESTYLVNGQDTENISGGASNANVPFPFIQEVQVKTSGIQAQYGGALGGVIDVITKKGGNEFHGSFFASYESDALDGSHNATLRYDPVPCLTCGPDADSQTYSPKKDHYRTVQPGFTIGGPIVKDRLWFFLGFDPQFNSDVRTVNFGAVPGPNSSLGNQNFNEDTQQYFTNARLDYAATQKIRLYGSWLYQYDRASGISLPNADSIASQNYLNTSIFSPLTQYTHGLGYAAPNATYNFGADISLTPTIVSTTRFGYFFDNYHDIGWPTQGVDLNYSEGGQGALDNNGVAIPSTNQLYVPAGASTAPYNQSFTQLNASKHYQFNEAVSFFKSGWWGTHNIEVGYEYNRLWNEINQHGNLPFVAMHVGQGLSYGASTAFGGANCALLVAQWGSCAGQYGYATVTDFATILKNSSGQLVPAVDNNHALFAQDSWTVGHGLTFNLGLRIEKESLPAPPGIGIAGISSINFPWSDKIEPRLGVAWGSPDGKLKIFGSYGVVNDVMKLLLAQTSFGAQGYETCAYPLGPDSNGTFLNSDVNLVASSAGRACPTGIASVGATFAGGVVPSVLTDSSTGVQLIENVNFRPEEPVAPNVKPYRQHEYVVGTDYMFSNNLALEVRYDRRRLDHVIEDASLADPNAFEIYNVVNPGQGVNRTLDGYASYLTSLGDAYGPGTAAFNPTGAFGTCPSCPPNPQAVRNYDGLEVRLTKTSRNFGGMFSYTWGRLWGNYTGLTTTDQIDGGTTGRNSPDTTRAFDEPFYYFQANGKSGNGPLPTDRPNTLKGDAYYELHWMGMTTTFGIFQQAYQGSPVSSWADLGLGVGSPIEGTYIWGRGNWVNATSDVSGNTILGNVYARRTPWFTQTDFQIQHALHVNKNNENQQLVFSATASNLLNQHAVTAYWAGINSDFYPSALFNGAIFGGAAFYQQVETGYNAQAAITGSGVPLNSQYGKPNLWQLSRNIRLGVTFNF